MGRRRASDSARGACLDQVTRAVFRSALGGIPTSLLLVVILGSSVPTSRRIAFVALVSTADVFTFVVTGLYLRRGPGRSPRGLFGLGLVGVGAISAAWGSLAVLGLPDVSHAQLRVAYLLFVCGCSAVYVVAAAADRRYYYASQVPVMLLVMTGFLSAPDGFSRMLGVAVPIYFALMTMLHWEVHNVVVSEIELRERNDLANVQLQDANLRLHEMNRALAVQARRDALTGLENRAAFTEELARALVDGSGRPGSVAVLYIDLDGFKIVNDSLGHAAGDDLLVTVADRISALTRSCDVLARYGGDEFTMLVTCLRETSEAVTIAERLTRVFSAPFDIAGRKLHISASVGVATNSDTSDRAETLISQADAAQYRAKQVGRNRVEVFDAQLRATLMRRLDDEQRLRAAIADHEIVAWYQPVVDLYSGEIIGAEALARWQHPSRGVLDAYTFVPLAEEAGLILALDDAVITDAVHTCAHLATIGLTARTDFRVWFNVSATQFCRTQPAQRLAELLTRADCAPNLVGIEITETAFLEDLAVAARELANARQLGIKIALDDFGVGYSSLTLLRTLPIDTIKIDRSFVRNLTQDTRDATIIKNVASLAHELGIDVVGEGVETPEQARLLRELGCNQAQGFLWAKAVPAEQLAQQLQTLSLIRH